MTRFKIGEKVRVKRGDRIGGDIFVFPEEMEAEYEGTILERQDGEYLVDLVVSKPPTHTQEWYREEDLH